MNLHVFTTGRGTPCGLAAVPVIKVDGSGFIVSGESEYPNDYFLISLTSMFFNDASSGPRQRRLRRVDPRR